MLCYLAMDVFSFIYELNRATTTFNSYIDAMIEPQFHITRAQFVALLFIDAFPDITKFELASKLSCSHVAAGRLATALDNKQYITSTPRPQNSHALCLRTTETGKTKIKEIKQCFTEQSAGLFSGIADSVDTKLLTAQLSTFTAALLSHRNK